MRRSPSLAWLLLLLAACGERESPGQLDPYERSCQLQFYYPIFGNPRFDLLIVVDESPAMAAEQERLAANLAAFASVLENVQGGLPDLHIGVVSADPARGGSLQTGCGLRDGARFLVDDYDETSQSRLRNYDGELGDVLACLGTLGAGGSTTAAPLQAMEAALDGSRAENRGFLRHDAFLVTVVLAAQDDCSGSSALTSPLACAAQGVRCSGVAPAGPGSYSGCVAASGPDVEPIDRYVDFLHRLKQDPNLILVGVAAGPSEPLVVTQDPALASSCAPDAPAVLPAVRLNELAERFPYRATRVSLCGEDWTPVLTHVAESLARPLIGPPCLGLVDARDLAPAAPGLQLDCTVAEVRFLATERETQRALPRCPMLDDDTPAAAGARPCWWVAEHPLCLESPYYSRLAVNVEREPGTSPSDTYLDIRCTGACE